VSARQVVAYQSDLEAERTGWYVIADLVRSLTPEECLVPGDYTDPDWSVRDAVAHIGTWLAEAEVQLERLVAGTYERVPVDVDGLNAELLEAMHDQSWVTCWIQANAGRTRMLEAWHDQHAAGEDAAWWIRKSGAEHYEEHLARLREWSAELRDRRTATG
jgi:hypothetical protein